MSDLRSIPRFALSIRQPWAWAILYGTKRHENRSEYAIVTGRMDKMVGKRIAIHAAKGMTRDEYNAAAAFIRERGLIPPPAFKLQRGGIVGSALVTNIVHASDDPWFVGPWALVLDDLSPCPFQGARGALGMFEWFANGHEPDTPAAWMNEAPGQAVLPELGGKHA